jgi:hypothetical protein
VTKHSLSLTLLTDLMDLLTGVPTDLTHLMDRLLKESHALALTLLLFLQRLLKPQSLLELGATPTPEISLVQLDLFLKQ